MIKFAEKKTEMSLKEQIDKNKLPGHIAIIMDGNGRWAKQKGKNRIFGHKNGVVSVRECVEASGELGVKYLTLYAFSTENWNRPVTEVEALMGLLVTSLHSELKNLVENNVILKTIGDIEKLPRQVRSNLEDVVAKTSQNTGLTLILALSYSSRWEIVHAMRKIAWMVEQKQLDPKAITEETISSQLSTSGIPDPELLIRTSGEFRISNFLLWQIAYCELYFSKKMWPDFRKDDLYEAILDFQNRERRFGKTSEQLKQ